MIKTSLSFLFIFFLAGIIIVFTRLSGFDIIQWKNIEYEPSPKKVEFETSVKGIVDEKMNNYGALVFWLNSIGSSQWIQTSVNYNYNPSVLADFVIPDDSIIKKRNNDTILIKRGENEFYFLLGKFLKNTTP